MPLDKQNVPIAFGQGINTKDDPKQLMPGKLTTLQNGIFSVGKEIKKRNGDQPLSKAIQGEGGTISSGVLVQTFNQELLELDGKTLYSYNASGPNWPNKGGLNTSSLTTTTVIRNTTQQTIQDSAINSNLQAFVWFDSLGQLGYSIFDTSTNQSIINNQQLSASGTVAKVLSLGSNFVFIYFDSGVLKYKTVNVATPITLSSAVIIASDINVNALFDATVFNNRIYIAYSSSSARISMYYLDSSLVLSSQLNVGAENADAAITVFGDASNQAWVGYGKSSTAKGFVATTSLSSAGPAFTINSSVVLANITGVVDGTLATYYYEVVGTNTLAGDPNNFIKSNIVQLSGTSGTPGVSSVFNRDVGLASKAFVYNSLNYFWTAKQSTLQSTYFLFNNVGVVVAKLAPDNGGGYTAHAILPEVNQVSARVFQTASLIKDLLIVQGGAVSTQTGVQSAVITFTLNSIPNIVLGENSLIGGGVISMYDGANVVEHGYHVFPETVSATVSTTASATTGNLLVSTIGTGTATTASQAQFQYSAVYEWTDNQGQIHRSAPSPGVTLQAGSLGLVASLSGTMGSASSTLTVTSTAGLAVGQFVTNSNGVDAHIFNSTIGTVGSATTVVLSGTAHTALNGQPFIVTNKPVAWMTSITAAAAGATQLTANSSNYANLAVGQLLTSGANGESSLFPAGTYITAISGTAGGDVTITISNPINTATSASTFIYSLDVYRVTITVPTLRITSKTNASIGLYRTEADGTVFFRVNSVSSPTPNTKSSDTVTITDTAADTVIIGNEQLYTTGGELENIEAPATRILQTFKSRAIAVPSESLLSWWYSKQVVPGSPVEFTDAFVNNIDSRIGEITAVGVLDEKIVFFGPTSKYYVVGDGPAASGANNDYSQAQHITGSTGCSNQNSILEIPVGLIYQDPTKGIYLLDRSLSESYIGQDVEQYNLDPITSAQAIPGTTALRLTLTSGTVLIYDWFYNQWGNDPFAAEVISSTLYKDKFTYVQANGLVLQETPGLFTENGAYYSLAPKTGWLSFAGIQGYQRVYNLLLLGNYKSPHTLTVNIYTNFDDSSIVQTFTIPVLSDPDPYEFRLFFNDQVQKCTAIKFEVSDSNQSGSGESYSLSNMAFRVGIKQGQNKLSAAKSF